MNAIVSDVKTQKGLIPAGARQFFAELFAATALGILLDALRKDRNR